MTHQLFLNLFLNLPAYLVINLPNKLIPQVTLRVISLNYQVSAVFPKQCQAYMCVGGMGQ